MSFMTKGLQLLRTCLRTSLPTVVVPSSQFHIWSNLCVRSVEEGNDQEVFRTVESNKDRSKVIPVERSIAYLNSKAYESTYGKDPVWKFYRRNHKGLLPPRKTRRTCIRGTEVTTGNPCPLCRDEYLVIDYKNTKLLEQFISKLNGDIISYEKTGVCQKKHRDLMTAIHKAKDYGTITFDVPLRQYNYSEWMPANKSEKSL
ncbi:hypothetical protein KM043_018105 [Ampulex compressa]|nr:hypothetical protein KM043_018105 [Ampulex compressa]